MPSTVAQASDQPLTALDHFEIWVQEPQLMPTALVQSPDIYQRWLDEFRRVRGRDPLPVAQRTSTNASPPRPSTTNGNGSAAHSPALKVVQPAPVEEQSHPPHETETVAKQTVMEGVAKPVAVPEYVPLRNRPTGTHYRDLPFFAAAEALVKSAPIAIAPSMQTGCALILSLLIAWMRHPLFGRLGGRSGAWVAFGVDRIMCELRTEFRTRNTELMAHLYQLERSGLVQIGNVRTGMIDQEDFKLLKSDLATLPPELGGGPGGYFPSHCFLTNTNIYRLKVELPLTPSLSLPVEFTPSLPKSLTPSRRGKSTEGVGKVIANPSPTPSQEGNTSEGVSDEPLTPSQPLPGSINGLEGDKRPEKEFPNPFPSGHDSDYESDNDNDSLGLEVEETNKEELTGLLPGQQIVYKLLLGIHHRLPNSESQPIAENTARDLAARRGSSPLGVDAALDATRKTMRETLVEKPVGYFIRCFEDQCNGRWRQATELARSKKKRRGSQRSFPAAQAVLNGHDEPGLEPVTVEVEEEIPAPMIHIPQEKLPELWQEVKQDLAGRYRLSANVLEALEGSRLALDGEQPVVILRYAWQKAGLSFADRSTIGLAIHQRLGQGYDNEAQFTAEG